MRTQLLFLLLFLAGTASAQTSFQPKVKIEFEKTIYVRQLVKATEPEWYEEIKDRLPESIVSYFDFMGDTARSVYKPGREVDQNKGFYNTSSDKNVVYTDYSAHRSVNRKQVFEEVFLVEDSLLHIRWKLTADTRLIAGYECRKAIGFVDDTLAVFAFYTDEILITGGPESIHGLPGMILGLGFPRIHATWFATKVEVQGVDMNKVKPETKGKKTTRRAMLQQIEKALKSWGPYGRAEMMNFVI